MDETRLCLPDLEWPVYQRWDRIRSTGVDSGRIVRFLSDPDPESNMWEKLDPDRSQFLISAVAGVCVVIS